MVFECLGIPPLLLVARLCLTLLQGRLPQKQRRDGSAVRRSVTRQSIVTSFSFFHHKAHTYPP